MCIYHVMLCYAMLCYAMLCYVMLSALTMFPDAESFILAYAPLTFCRPIIFTKKIKHRK